MRDASQNSYGCWRGAMLAHHIFHGPCSLQILQSHTTLGIMDVGLHNHGDLNISATGGSQISGGKAAQSSDLVPHAKHNSLLICRKGLKAVTSQGMLAHPAHSPVSGLH